MPSFNSVNYSLRPSKSIQRQLVVEGIKKVFKSLSQKNYVYIGFGSVWFTDFVIAHKELNIDHMVSIESDEIGHSRARFNSPYATVFIKQGMSNDVIPELMRCEPYKDKPCLAWLDYDFEYNESVQTDVRYLLEKSPENSVVLLTVNAVEMKYGDARARLPRIKALFGELVPDELSKKACKGDKFPETLGKLMLDYMIATIIDSGRSGSFLPLFNIIYKDGATMVTVGGILASSNEIKSIQEILKDPEWPCFPDKPISAPHLTIKETSALQSLLPNEKTLDVEQVKNLGFELEKEHIETFQKYYKQFPSYAQIVF